MLHTWQILENIDAIPEHQNCAHQAFLYFVLQHSVFLCLFCLQLFLFALAFLLLALLLFQDMQLFLNLTAASGLMKINRTYISNIYFFK